ncbi:MAG: hypothetical protein JWO54_216 [Candidatus Saccharibacteria bacterium]|nr:hypothetical protein [Candidatus Saccharibacteria bacterium]
MTNPEQAELQNLRTIVPADITLDQLMEKLIAGNVPVDQFGVGNAKTVLHLLTEIVEGETVMTIDDNHNVYRNVNVLWADVLCELADGKVYILREDRQEFKDGRVKRRALGSSIGEKLKPSESPEDAINRALQEELGVKTIDRIHKIGYNERTFIPDPFPGLESSYQMHKFVTVIPESEFKSEGYVEYQQDKTNYYVWELLNN